MFFPYKKEVSYMKEKQAGPGKTSPSLETFVDKGISFLTPAARALFPGQMLENDTSDEKLGLYTRTTVASTEYLQWDSSEIDLTELHPEVRDFHQTFDLSNNEDYLIDPSIHSVDMGFGWEKDVDMDVSVALFDVRNRVVDTVWYRKLRSTCHSVKCLQDNSSGLEEGDDEVVSVDMDDLPLHICYLLFTITTFSYDVSSSQIDTAYVRMMHCKEEYKNREMCHFSLTGMRGHAAMVGALTRKGPHWSFRALGIPATGRTIQELLQNSKNLECLNANPSRVPELMHITVTVIKATGLVAMDPRGLALHASSRPYFVLTFKKKTYTSEHTRRTLEPEWISHPFQLCSVSEVETRALEVQIFDYNAVENDDFLGMIRIPGHALYRLGPGGHTYWFELGTSKEKAYRHAAVSGKVLLHFRIEESTSHSEDLHHPGVHQENSSNRSELSGMQTMNLEQIAQAPRDSSTHVDIEENEGMPSLVPAGRQLSHANRNAHEGEYTLARADLRKKSPDRTFGKVIHGPGTASANMEYKATTGTEIVKEASLASTPHEHQMEADSRPEELMDAECCLLTNDTNDTEESSSSSEGVWIPDEPYGSRGRLLTAIKALRHGQDFADDYTIIKRDFTGKPCLCLAEQKIGKRELVVLKFYWEEATLENTIEMHSKIARSEYVCRILGTLKTSRTGHPPCIAFEKGTRTLSDWLRSDHEMFERTWCLQQILSGLRDLHERDIVHCDVKPSNVVFFAESVAWKIIDLDGARKARESRVSCFTAPYAAPEVLREWPEGELPVALPSVDMWSCGILAYEVLTGVQMFEGDWTQEDICEFVLDGRVEEKLNSMENDSHRETISKFLQLDPNKRWLAVDALQHTIFQPDSQTTMKEA